MGGGGVCSKILWFPLMLYATWPCSEKVDILPTDPIVRVRSAGKIFASMLLHFLIPFNLICNMTLFWKVELWPFDPRVGDLPAKYLLPSCNIFAIMLLHFLIPFNLICNMTMFWNSGMGQRYGGVCSKISWFPLMWYATWPCSEKVDILPTDPITRVRSAGKIFATMLLYFMIPINLICNMTMFWENWILAWGPFSRVRVGDVEVCAQKKCYFVAALLIPFNLICNMTMFWKCLILTFWPRVGSGWAGSASKIFATLCYITLLDSL